MQRSSFLSLGMLLGVLLAGPDAGLGQATAGADDVRQRARATLADPSLQTELPLAPQRADGTPRERAGRRGDTPPGPPREPPRPPIYEGPVIAAPPASGGVPFAPPGGEVLKAFLWAVLLAGLVVAVAWLGQALARRRRSAVALPAHDLTDALPGPSYPGDAEALAHAGRYDEAVHLLLQQALARLARGAAGRWAGSLTSREILRRPELDLHQRMSLEILVVTVERSWFGQRPVAFEAYLSCLAASQRLGTRARVRA